MKIGILTHPLETNYGGLLQAFALQKVLRDMGHEVLTIDRHNRPHYSNIAFHLLSYAKRLKDRYVNKKIVSPCWNPFIDEKTYQIISQNTTRFIEKNINVTRKVWTENLSEIDNEYIFDAYVVGSDQVWLPSYCPESFLNFVRRKGVLKIFYAASAGRTSFADNRILREECRKLATDFDGISVREEKLRELSIKYLGKDAEWVLDPTLLLSPDDYIGLTDLGNISCNKVFSYILDKNEVKTNIINKICDLEGKTIYWANVKQYYKKGVSMDLEECIFPSVESWLNNIIHSSYVVTDSFHGTVMAILFNKPFITICNNKRGASRFLSLLSMFGINNRIVNNYDDVELVYNTPIDYSIINSILNIKRTQSLAYLKNYF